MAKVILPQTRFGRWTVLHQKSKLCLCKCDCGTERWVRSQNLRDGKSISCGCYHKEQVRKASTTHGLSKSPEWKTWNMMLQRCYNPREPTYRYYGARGITVCDEWRHSFMVFYGHIGQRPSGKYSLERKDNNKGYSPDNCQWSTRKEQMRNTRRTVLLTANGETLCIKDWAIRLNTRAPTIRNRLNRGLTIEQAVTLPITKGVSLKKRLLKQQEKR